MTTTYIIGNGFDLNLGLRTSYTNFYDYYNSLKSSEKEIKFLKDSINRDYQSWSDLELGLGEYTKELKTIEDFEGIYEDITEQLAIYLENEEKLFDFTRVDIEKFMSDLCFPENYLPFEDMNLLKGFKSNWKKEHWNTNIITLNYTHSIEKILKDKKLNTEIGNTPYNGKIYLRNLEHLHGFLDERMIMGVNDISQITNKEFQNEPDIIEALVKPISNSASKSGIDKKCSQIISGSHLICIFGSSIGDTDKIWWELIGDCLKTGIRVIIFSRGDEISKRRPYKKLRHDRERKKHFLDKTSLTESEKEKVSENIL